MKKVFPVTLLCLAVSFFLCSLPFAQPVAGPRMIIKERVHDLGEANEGMVVEHSFVVENRGDQALEIRQVKPG